MTTESQAKPGWFTRVFGLDLRALAVLRILAAAVVLLDIASRARDLEAHYTDDGVLPRWVSLQMASHPWDWSFHMMSGQWCFAALLFALHAAAALLLMAGYRTRFVTFITWMLTVSLQNRNTMILNNSDVVIRVVLLWGMMLPWGRRFSLDSLRDRDGKPDEVVHVSWASAALVLQILSIYFFTALLKRGPHWNGEGAALYYALSLDMYASPLAALFLQLPAPVLSAMTHATWWVEMLVSFLFLCPLWTPVTRTAGVFILIALFLGIGTVLSVGMFPLICISCALVLLPTEFIDALGQRLREVTSPGLRAALVARCRRIGEQLLRVLPDVPPPSTSPLARELRAIARLQAPIFLGAYMLLTNIGGLPGAPIGVGGWQWLGRVLRLEQRWDMYAPIVYNGDGWYVIEGTLEDGRTVDLFPYAMGGAPRETITWEKPWCVAWTFKTQRWQKYLTLMKDPADREHSRYFTGWLLWKWNSQHAGGDRLKRVKVWFVNERTQLYRPPAVWRELVWTAEPRS